MNSDERLGKIPTAIPGVDDARLWQVELGILAPDPLPEIPDEPLVSVYEMDRADFERCMILAGALARMARAHCREYQLTDNQARATFEYLCVCYNRP